MGSHPGPWAEVTCVDLGDDDAALTPALTLPGKGDGDEVLCGRIHIAFANSSFLRGAIGKSDLPPPTPPQKRAAGAGVCARRGASLKERNATADLSCVVRDFLYVGGQQAAGSSNIWSICAFLL